MVHAHAAVGVDRDHGPCLVELGGSEADAEFDGRKSQSFFDDAVGGVPVRNGLAALAVAAVCGQPCHQGVQDVVFDLHAVGCGVPLPYAIKVGQAHIQRVQAQVAGHVAHQGFDQQHTLRAAKAAVGGVTLGVGFAAVRGDAHIAQVVGVVGVEDGAVRHRTAQVGTVTAVRQLHGIEREHSALRIKPDLPIVAEGMAFASDHKVVAPVQAHLHGAPQFVCSQRGPDGQVPCLGFLAAKATPHAAADHPHLVQGNTQSVGYPVLHLSGVLGAAVDQPLPTFLGFCAGDLALQIKVFLPANVQAAAQAVGCGLQGLLGLAALDLNCGQDEKACLQGLAGVQHRRAGAGLQLDELLRGVACAAVALAQHQADHLSHMGQFGAGKNAFVVHISGQHRVAGDVLRGDDADHPRGLQGRLSIELQQLPMGHRAEDGGRMQQAFETGQVVDVISAALDLGGSAFVKMGGALVHASVSSRVFWS